MSTDRGGSDLDVFNDLKPQTPDGKPITENARTLVGLQVPEGGLPPVPGSTSSSSGSGSSGPSSSSSGSRQLWLRQLWLRQLWLRQLWLRQQWAEQHSQHAPTTSVAAAQAVRRTASAGAFTPHGEVAYHREHPGDAQRGRGVTCGAFAVG